MNRLLGLLWEFGLPVWYATCGALLVFCLVGMWVNRDER